LNCEPLYFWRYRAMVDGVNWEHGADIAWSGPFGPWTVTMADSPGGSDSPVQCVLDWNAWVVSDDFPVYITMHIEGIGGIPRNLQLVITNPENGTVDIAPEQPKYADGQTVTLTAIPDPNGKGFNKWAVKDLLDANNKWSDSNAVLNLAMDSDYEVKAKFKCGSALPPFVGMVLLALGLAVVIRRMT